MKRSFPFLPPVQTQVLTFEQLLPARQALCVRDNALHCVQLLQDPVLCRQLEQAGLSAWPQRGLYVDLGGLALLRQGLYSQAAQHFTQVGRIYQAGHAWMLAGDLEAARGIWLKLVALRRSHWCVFLYGLVTRQLTGYPSFLQVRNHLESDVFDLARAGQENFLNNLLSQMDLLSQANPEACKLAGRALMATGRMVDAKALLYKAQSLLPQDAEIYFHLAQYYQTCRQGAEARLMIRQCLAINPHYSPARKLLGQL